MTPLCVRAYVCVQDDLRLLYEALLTRVRSDASVAAWSGPADSLDWLV